MRVIAFALMVLSGLSLDRRWVVSGLSLYRLALVISMGSSGSVAFAFMGCACGLHEFQPVLAVSLMVCVSGFRSVHI